MHAWVWSKFDHWRESKCWLVENHVVVLEWECWFDGKWEGKGRFYCWVLRLHSQGWRREVEVRVGKWRKEGSCCWKTKGINTWAD